MLATLDVTYTFHPFLNRLAVMADTHTSVIKEKVDVNGKVDESHETAEVKSKNEEVSDEIQAVNGEVRAVIKYLRETNILLKI